MLYALLKMKLYMPLPYLITTNYTYLLVSYTFKNFSRKQDTNYKSNMNQLSLEKNILHFCLSTNNEAKKNFIQQLKLFSTNSFK